GDASNPWRAMMSVRATLAMPAPARQSRSRRVIKRDGWQCWQSWDIYKLVAVDERMTQIHQPLRLAVNKCQSFLPFRFGRWTTEGEPERPRHLRTGIVAGFARHALGELAGLQNHGGVVHENERLRRRRGAVAAGAGAGGVRLVEDFEHGQWN